MFDEAGLWTLKNGDKNNVLRHVTAILPSKNKYSRKVHFHKRCIYECFSEANFICSYKIHGFNFDDFSYYCIHNCFGGPTFICTYRIVSTWAMFHVVVFIAVSAESSSFALTKTMVSILTISHFVVFITVWARPFSFAATKIRVSINTIPFWQF